ncbi:MAG: class I SAM-dependent methyltransferase [Terriglobales bacterium]
MKTLVTIANYGTGNDRHLSRVLDEYRRMKPDVDIVVTSNIPKNLGGDVEVIVGLPATNPRSLPFAHKRVFAERLESYQLFIYTEDDILITGRNIDAFLRATEMLPENQIASFFRSETDSGGELYFPEAHKHYHWDITSVNFAGGYTLASFTNEHAGCYAVTQAQLRRAIASGGYLLPPREGKYGMLETAATDIYTLCGLRKVICISHFEDFIVPHLSNKYAGKGTLGATEFYSQIGVLSKLGKNGHLKGLNRNEASSATLIPVETRLYHQHYSKSYYEPRQEHLLSLVPSGTRRALSFGCGWGETEKALIERGTRVTAIPLDPVVAANAASRGVEIIYGDLSWARRQLAGQRFDCLILSNVLHLVPDPVKVLSSLLELLTPQGCVVASVPHFPLARRISRRIRLRGLQANPVSYESSGMHPVTGRILRRWFRKAGLKPRKAVYEIPPEKELAHRLSLGLAESTFGSEVYLLGRRVGAARPTARKWESENEGSVQEELIR